MSRWIVTGASGFVGKNLVRVLPGAVGLLRQHVSRWDRENLTRALEGAAGVIHAASVVHKPSTPPEEYVRFNVEGTRALVEAARAVGARRFVFISSIKVHGETPPSPIDETTPVAATLDYAKTKAEAERIVLDATDLAPVVLRLCPVYGVGDKGNVRTMIRAIWRRRFLIPGRGSVQKSIVHVSTVADVVRAAMMREASGVFVVADARTPSIRELADTIAELLGRRRPIAIPAPLLAGVASGVGRLARSVGLRTSISGDLIRKAQTSSICDPSRAVRELGVSCHVDLRDSLREEIDWLRRDRLL